MAERKAWSRGDQLVALHLYLTEPFGRLHNRNPRIIELAEQMGRSANSLNMKANNFASLDPEFLATGKHGLAGASAADRKLWAEFAADRVRLGEEMEATVEALGATTEAEARAEEPNRLSGPSERTAQVKQRRHQRFFRAALRAAYEDRCAVTGLDQPELNIASHIIPWAANELRRADPSNGILLNALFDRAFDTGLITFDEQRRVLCAPRLHRKPVGPRRLLLDHEGARLRVPDRFSPAEDALRWHRERRFLG